MSSSSSSSFSSDIFLTGITGFIDRSENSYLFSMTGVPNFKKFDYFSSQDVNQNGLEEYFIRLYPSGELQNKNIPVLNLDLPFRIILAHKWNAENIIYNEHQYVPFILDCSGISGISKFIAVYQTPISDLEPTGAQIYWGVYNSENKIIGPAFKAPYRSLPLNTFNVDQFIYSGSNFLGDVGSIFVRNKVFLKSEPVTSLPQISFNNDFLEKGSKIGYSGVSTPGYQFDLGELLIFNRYLSDLELIDLKSRLQEKWTIDLGSSPLVWGRYGGNPVPESSSSSSSSSPPWWVSLDPSDTLVSKLAAGQTLSGIVNQPIWKLTGAQLNIPFGYIDKNGVQSSFYWFMEPFDSFWKCTGLIPQTWEVVSGSLPPGLQLDSDRFGVIFGTALQQGEYSAIIRQKYCTGLFQNINIYQDDLVKFSINSNPNSTGNLYITDNSRMLFLCAYGFGDYYSTGVNGSIVTGSEPAGESKSNPLSRLNNGQTLHLALNQPVWKPSSFLTINNANTPGQIVLFFMDPKDNLWTTFGAGPYAYGILSGSMPPGLDWNPGQEFLGGEELGTSVSSFGPPPRLVGVPTQAGTYSMLVRQYWCLAQAPGKVFADAIVNVVVGSVPTNDSRRKQNIFLPPDNTTYSADCDPGEESEYQTSQALLQNIEISQLLQDKDIKNLLSEFLDNSI